MDPARPHDPSALQTKRSRRGKAKQSARRVPNVQRLSVVLTGDEPPTEFCLFTAGKVDTTKGEFIFDDAAAAAVMAEYVAHGIDLMIDYDHASLASVTLDPAQTGKAAGWFNLEVRGGELWAVNVRWTEPAAAALRAKEWRFMSPAFATEDGRITSVLNVAITNLPATRRLEPLMAANAITALGENAMSVEEFLKVCKALDIDMSGSLEDAMAKIKGESKEEEKKDEGEKPEPKPAAEPVAAAAPEEEKPEEIAAALSAVASLSGKTSLVASVADIRTWHASHVAHESNLKALAAREAVLESAERRKLCVELVTLGGRAPSTVWADDTAKEPKGYLAAMPIADLRAMHSDSVKASGKGGAPLKPPSGKAAAGGALDAHGLDARELAICAETKCLPATFAMLKARRSTTA